MGRVFEFFMPTGIYIRTKSSWNRGKKLSEEHRRKIGLSSKGRKHTKESKRKISKASMGRKWSEEHKRKMSGQNNHKWRGKNVGYRALHHWIRNHLGNPRKCEHCGTIKAKKFEWANKSHKYQRDLSDWLRLCTSCHKKYDYVK